MKVYFIERKDGLIFNSFQEGGNPPLDDQLRRREIAAETHGGSPNDWTGRVVEVDLAPGYYIASILSDGYRGYKVVQKSVPEPEPPEKSPLEIEIDNLKQRVAMLETQLAIRR